MNEECLICKAPLEYLLHEETMECSLCHKKFSSNTRCVKGHYVCDECHSQGLDTVLGFCLDETAINPFEILEKLMALPACHMHGPEHHILVGSALLTAFKNAGGNIDLPAALTEMQNRGSKVPGGICGMWGSCGAAVSSGIFVSIVTGSTPLADEAFGLANTMTSRSLAKISAVGGPRCCKRNSYLAISAAVEFVREKLGISMESSCVRCSHMGKNNQCIGKRCPFFNKQES